MDKQIGTLIILLALFFSSGKAQSPEVIRKGLIRAHLTLSPSYMFGNQQSYFYLHGNLEGFVTSDISLAGEFYYQLGSISLPKSDFDHHHNLFFGAAKHFTRKNSDLFLGIQPGLAITQLNPAQNNISSAHLGVNPLVSATAGYNFFLNQFMHFFLHSRIIIGQHTIDLPRNLTEFRFSAGLGFNINAIKSSSAPKPKR